MSSRPAVSRVQTPVQPTRPTIFKPRTSKACEECRRRKAKCDGLIVCTPCMERGLSCCSYRDKTRNRRRKQANRQRASVEPVEREESQIKEANAKYRDLSFVPTPFPQMTKDAPAFASQRPYQVHYGASSNISLVNHLFQYSNTRFGGDLPIFQVDDFSGYLGENSAETVETAMAQDNCQKSIFPVDELPLSLATEILERFLAVHQFLVPLQSPKALRGDLRVFYDPESRSALSNVRRRALLLVLAIGSLTTIHHRLANKLILEFNQSTVPSDDNLTTISIEIDCLLACYYTEKGFYNNAYLSIGSAIRKVFSAGLHRDPPQGSRSDLEIEEQRNLVWVLYNFESWICVHLGRPSSFTAVQLAVPLPKDPFFLALVRLSDIMAKCSNEIYIPTKGSLLPMWKSAVSLMSELHKYEDKVIATLGFGLHHRSQLGELDARQTILTTLYLHTIILVFRPFFIFSGKLKAQQVLSEYSHDSSPTNPPWLDKACDYVLDATKRLVNYIFIAMSSNQTVKDMRYNHVFLENCCAVLSYDILHDPNKMSANVPLITKSLLCLSQMRPGDSIQRIITSFQNLLEWINKGNSWSDTGSTEWLSLNDLNRSLEDCASPVIHDPSTWHHRKETIELLDDALRRVLF